MSTRCLLRLASTSFPLPYQHVRYTSRKANTLECMADMVSKLMALETRDVSDSSRPQQFGPKPNALKDSPEEEPIPPLPAPVKGYPTPWITQYDVITYVYPLYTRGWGQSLKSWTPPLPKTASRNVKGLEEAEKEESNEEQERYTMLFSAKYKFKDYDSMVEFFLKLVKVAKAENHHPSVVIANGSPFTVTVTTQTDSAKRPTWVEEEQQQSQEVQHPAQPASSESSPSPGESAYIPAAAVLPPRFTRAPLKIPGLTLRDVRLAILTDMIYTTHFTSHLSSLGRHIHPANFRLSWDSMERIWKRQVLLPGVKTGRKERRQKWLEVRRKSEQSELGRTRNKSRIRCYACDGDHHVNDCTKRAEIKPHSPCPYCGEMHWSIDCPVKAAKHINQ